MKLIPVVTLFFLVACSVNKAGDNKSHDGKKKGEVILTTLVDGRWRGLLGEDVPDFKSDSLTEAIQECVICEPIHMIKMVWNEKYDRVIDIAMIKHSDDGQNTLYMNSKYFGDLRHINVAIGNVGKVGVVRHELFKWVSYRDAIFMLMHTEHIRTYLHIEAKIRLVKEVEDKAVYTAHFDATHRYCTNDCYDDDYTFTVSIDKSTGLVSVL